MQTGSAPGEVAQHATPSTIEVAAIQQDATRALPRTTSNAGGGTFSQLTANPFFTAVGLPRHDEALNVNVYRDLDWLRWVWQRNTLLKDCDELPN